MFKAIITATLMLFSGSALAERAVTEGISSTKGSIKVSSLTAHVDMAGDLAVAAGVATSSLAVTNGVTAASGTFTATGAAQFSIKTSSGISVGGPIRLPDGTVVYSTSQFTSGGGSGVCSADVGTNSVVCQGDTNSATATNATVSGGSGNTASNQYDFIGGGLGNTASGVSATVVGGGGTSGANNQASGDYSFIGGGQSNHANNTEDTVAGGSGNTAGGIDSFVGGGIGNTANGFRSTVPGGYVNSANGEGSFAAGVNATASNDFSFVWSDTYTTNYNSHGPYTFNIEADSGVYVDTTYGLYVTSGTIEAKSSSVTASAFFGDGSHLTGLSASFSGGYVPSVTTFGSTVTVSGTAFSVGGSAFNVKTSSVGIGILAGSAPLAIKGSSGFGQVLLEDPSGGFVGSFGVESSAGQIVPNSSQGDFSLVSPLGFNFGNGGNALMRLTTAGSLTVKSTSTVVGNAFSVGGSTLVVIGGKVGVGTATPSSTFTVAGLVESTGGGYKFPDGSVQTTASSGGGSGSSYNADEVSLHLNVSTFSALSSSVTLQGNQFNVANKLLKLDTNGNIPASFNVSTFTVNAITDNFLSSVNGSQTSFTTSQTSISTTAVHVVLDGLIQGPNDYTISGNTITMTTAPATDSSSFYVFYDIFTSTFPTSLSYNQSAGGDLAGSFPSPTLNATQTNIRTLTGITDIGGSGVTVTSTWTFANEFQVSSGAYFVKGASLTATALTVNFPTSTIPVLQTIKDANGEHIVVGNGSTGTLQNDFLTVELNGDTGVFGSLDVNAVYGNFGSFLLGNLGYIDSTGNICFNCGHSDPMPYMFTLSSGTMNIDGTGDGFIVRTASMTVRVSTQGALDVSGGPVPTFTGCGTTPTVDAGSNCMRGGVTMTATPSSSCTLSFPSSCFASTPHCQLGGGGAGTAIFFQQSANLTGACDNATGLVACGIGTYMTWNCWGN